MGGRPLPAFRAGSATASTRWPIRIAGRWARFIDALRPLWEPREAELNLMLGVACAVRDGTRPSRGANLFATLEHHDRTIAAALRTARFGFAVAADGAQAAAELARQIAERGAHRDAPSVIASSPAARAFADAWSLIVGRTSTLGMRQRILALTSVSPPPSAPGWFRRAIPEDAESLTAWSHDYELEMAPGAMSAHGRNEEHTRTEIETGSVFVWETSGDLVSTAVLRRATPNGAVVSGVYTPPAKRGRGFASACVAALSEHVLDGGKRFVCLYTDASNPTSNAIYERIGYGLVCESELWLFADNVER